jgi:hypothetical protein
VSVAGRHDHAERRRGLRKARERGCSIYIDAGALKRAGFGPDDPPPFYRTWAGPRGRIVVQLYREK